MSGDDSSHGEKLKLQKPEDDQRNQRPLQSFPHIQVKSSTFLAVITVKILIIIFGQSIHVKETMTLS